MAIETRTYSLRDGFAQGSPGLPLAESDHPELDRVTPQVLIVDDEKLLADTTAAILRRAGFETRTAYDGWKALEIARSFRIDHLLTDVMMPFMNGVELAIAITKLHPSTRVLLVSGQAGITDILREGRVQGYEFPLLAKPVHPLALVEALKRRP